MITPTRISFAIATVLAVAAVAIPGAPAAGEPKNDVPFVAAMSTPPPAGERKNQVPFVTDGKTRRAEAARLPHSSRMPVGEAKNQTPFTRG